MLTVTDLDSNFFSTIYLTKLIKKIGTDVNRLLQKGTELLKYVQVRNIDAVLEWTPKRII